MDLSWVADRLILWVPLVFSLSVHEFAHAWSAFQLGDETAAEQGRLTLDPISHMDPIGTVLLPLMGVPFGWAKPVPVNPVRFRRDISMRDGMMITAVAGPLSNLLLAVVFAMALAVVVAFVPSVLVPGNPIGGLLQMGLVLNVLLAIFNMLPIPPLDGSRVADGLMPDSLRPAWEQLAGMGPILLLAVIFLPNVMGFSLFDLPIRWSFEVVGWMAGLLVG